MKNVKTKTLLILLLTVFIFMGCTKAKHEKAIFHNDDSKFQFQIDTNKIIRVGRHFYIPTNIKGTPDENAFLILEILNAFETSSISPKMKITSWHIEKQQEVSNNIKDFVFGLWIDCEPIDTHYNNNKEIINQKKRKGQ